MAAYRRVYDSSHVQADCQEPGSAPEPYARQSSMRYVRITLHGIVAYTFCIACEEIRQFLSSIKKMHTKKWFFFSASRCR